MINNTFIFLQKTVDILKIDIEYSEWESFEAILREGSLRNVKQLMVEFHTMEVHEHKVSTALNYAYYWHILRGLDKLGFKTWHYLQTPTGHYTSAHSGIKLPCCANVYFVNTALLIWFLFRVHAIVYRNPTGWRRKFVIGVNFCMHALLLGSCMAASDKFGAVGWVKYFHKLFH